jgi:hypothetical protein
LDFGDFVDMGAPCRATRAKHRNQDTPAQDVPSVEALKALLDLKRHLYAQILELAATHPAELGVIALAAYRAFDSIQLDQSVVAFLELELDLVERSAVIGSATGFFVAFASAQRFLRFCSPLLQKTYPLGLAKDRMHDLWCLLPELTPEALRALSHRRLAAEDAVLIAHATQLQPSVSPSCSGAAGPP